MTGGNGCEKEVFQPLELFLLLVKRGGTRYFQDSTVEVRDYFTEQEKENVCNESSV